MCGRPTVRLGVWNPSRRNRSRKRQTPVRIEPRQEKDSSERLEKPVPTETGVNIREQDDEGIPVETDPQIIPKETEGAIITDGSSETKVTSEQ